jgi:hypothetical protein
LCQNTIKIICGELYLKHKKKVTGDSDIAIQSHVFSGVHVSR